MNLCLEELRAALWTVWNRRWLALGGGLGRVPRSAGWSSR